MVGDMAGEEEGIGAPGDLWGLPSGAINSLKPGPPDVEGGASRPRTSTRPPSLPAGTMWREAVPVGRYTLVLLWAVLVSALWL